MLFLINAVNGIPGGNTLLDIYVPWCFISLSTVVSIILSNLQKTVRKGGIPMGCDNLRKLVFFQKVKRENVAIKNIFVYLFLNLTVALKIHSTAERTPVWSKGFCEVCLSSP